MIEEDSVVRLKRKVAFEVGMAGREKESDGGADKWTENWRRIIEVSGPPFSVPTSSFHTHSIQSHFE